MCSWFFFSGRRRHTRSYGDWSSDVCSSDLNSLQDELAKLLARYTPEHPDVVKLKTQIDELKKRSEERRVGSEGSTSAASGVSKRNFSYVSWALSKSRALADVDVSVARAQVR